jgi:hypothetical protein
VPGSNSIKILLAIVFLCASIHARCQFIDFKTDTVRVYKNELGIDLANVMTFLKRDPQSYLINYKYYLTPKSALRGGLNLDVSSVREDGNYVNSRVGYERGIQSERWRLFYGVDASFSYSKNNLQSNKTYRVGVEPLVGASYYISKHFSISSEIKLNYFYYIYRDPGSFDPEANTEENQLSVGSVGMILLNYHFKL